MKKVTIGLEGLNRIKNGVNILADAVKVTLGPKGRNVVISRGEYGLPHITKDGVTVAQSIFLEDNFEQMGVEAVKEVASQVAIEAGDGTTTATILTQSILNLGYKLIMSGANPIDVKKGMDLAVEDVVNFIKTNSDSVVNQIINIATISANNDPQIGKIISDAFDKVGSDGMILIEDSPTADTTIQVIDGFKIDRGYTSTYLVNDFTTMSCILEDAYVLLTDEKIEDLSQILPLLETILAENRSLLIICEDVSPLILQTIIQNKLKVGIVKSPGFGESTLEILEDLAVTCSTEVITKDCGYVLSDITTDTLGFAKKVIIDKESTKIIEGIALPNVVSTRINQLKNRVFSADNYEKDRLLKRISDLSGGVAIIKVGAFTEIELKEKKDRIEDCLKAVRSAIEEGIVPGGGIAYICAQNAIDFTKSKNMDQKSGMDVIKKTMEYPITLMCQTLEVDASYIISEIRRNGRDYGYNMKKEKFEESMLKAGIIDPAKVIRVALQKAVSVASTLLTTNVVISYA